ncbi:MAG TPA: cation transporting ATPase C-terminal domain-containing protein, partial [Polyangiaceae bacterium]|nr:cation transporting ATPase C-terminal domain-containing protein [Polyangiaceae bacterium]
DMVLADDNFASIVAAIHQGRGIFDNIRKALVYLLAGNAGELLLMLTASLLGLPLPLLPLHLLWINLVTDGFPALALVMDPADADAMTRPARHPSEPLLGRVEWTWIGLTAVLQTVATLGVFLWALRTTDLNQARSLTFCLIVFEELLRSFALRSPTRVFWEIGVLGNRMLVSVVIFSVGVQVALHHLPFTQALFKINELSPSDWLRTVLIALGPVTVLELSKLYRRSKRKIKALA